MKSINTQELDLICRKLQHCESGQLQEIRFSENCFDFGFWLQGKKYWWHLSLDVLRPILLPMDKARLPKKSQNKPIYLFLKAHALGKKLKTVTHPPKMGRVLYLVLKGLHPNPASMCEIEMRLFPHGQNLIVSSDNKKISIRPVKKLETLDLKEPTTCRPIQTLIDEFHSFYRPTITSPKKIWVHQVDQLERSLRKVSQDLEKKSKLPWKKIGELLVQTQSLQVPSEWSSYVDTGQTLSWNIENCFSKSKTNIKKIEGTKTRIKELQKQLNHLKKNQTPFPTVTPLPPLVHIKARKMNLPEGAIVWVGKNAQDNTKLLRQAQPWDIWTHLVDHPSCHGLIRRHRGLQISHTSLEAVGNWLVRYTFGEKSKNRQGDLFEMLYTECRYVSPIKGDKVGRMTYRNEKVIRFRFQ